MDQKIKNDIQTTGESMLPMDTVFHFGEELSYVKKKLKEKTKDYYSDEVLEKIALSVTGLDDEWGLSILQHSNKDSLHELYELKIGFNSIRSALKEEVPVLFYDDTVKRLFQVLKMFDPSLMLEYQDSNNQISNEHCNFLKKEFVELFSSTLILAQSPQLKKITKSSNKKNSILFEEISCLYLKIFKTELKIFKSSYGAYSGDSLIFLESIFYVLNLSDCRNQLLDSLINFTKDKRRKSCVN